MRDPKVEAEAERLCDKQHGKGAWGEMLGPDDAVEVSWDPCDKFRAKARASLAMEENDLGDVLPHVLEWRMAGAGEGQEYWITVDGPGGEVARHGPFHRGTNYVKMEVTHPGAWLVGRLEIRSIPENER